ncbi:hypothetical protein ON010_g11744 [Phytophthora cinnamomi]|nr:hypothetical protein ON010_g11744 [Phytophthora cinnamomi]
MKVQIIIAALATLLLPVHGADEGRLQCAGGNKSDGSGIIYENSGFLTADFTQKVCAKVGGSIDPTKKGNDKCCILPEGRIKDFQSACESQKAGSNYPNYRAIPRFC